MNLINVLWKNEKSESLKWDKRGRSWRDRRTKTAPDRAERPQWTAVNSHSHIHSWCQEPLWPETKHLWVWVSLHENIVQRSRCCLWTFASVWRLTSSIRSKHWHLSMNRWFIGVLYCRALKWRRHRWVSNRRRTTGNLEDVFQTCCSS